MSNKMLVTVKLDQQLKMSQQLRQAISLLHYPTLELKQLVKQSLLINPLLEVDESYDSEEVDHSSTDEASENDSELFQANLYSAHISRSSVRHEEDSLLENISNPKSLRTHLLEQTLLCQFNELEQCIAEAIIDAIDEKGYLTMSVDDLQTHLSHEFQLDKKIILEVLKKIQTLDPLGVAARDIKECLILQLKGLTNKNSIVDLCCRVIQDGWDLLPKHNIKLLSKQLNISEAELKESIALIRTLNPAPGALFSNQAQDQHEPELYVKKIKDKWCVFLSESILTQVKINHHYQSLIKKNRKQGSFQTLKKELEEARWLLKGLKRRNDTLLAVGQYIIEAQEEFLEKGIVAIKPMTISEVAQSLSLHESTISRITNGKYIVTPAGVFELKYFFPSYVSTVSGHTRSSIAVKTLIKEIITQEAGSKRLSDEDITAKLKEKGINIARRTVAKYRESMNIMASYHRVDSFEESTA